MPVDLEARLAMVKEVGEEIVTEEELRALLAAKAHPIAYDGFEPSGTAHIAQGVMRAINVNKMTQAGVRFKMFVADWHAWANNKMGGDLERIQTTGKYLIEVWRATGMDLSKVDFIWASEFVEDEAYWKKVMNIARETSLDRVLRTTQIMGRSEKDKLSAAQILYPCMQAADIFHLQADITQLGMDQRKVNMLAREVGPKLGFWKPVVVSHHMLMGLTPPPPEWVKTAHRATIGQPTRVAENVDLVLSENADGTVRVSLLHGGKPFGQSLIITRDFTLTLTLNLQVEGAPTETIVSEIKWIDAADADIALLVKSGSTERATAMKMSKSNPDSAIFMTDTPEQVQAKIKKAYCPEKRAEENPILEYYRYIIFERFPRIKIDRSPKFGGELEFRSYAELEESFVKGALHPADAKAGCAAHINRLLDPVREHFEKNAAARELKQQVDSFKVTR